MSIKLLRESSETPNITNKDDVRMIRYAYGGYDGVVQKYGEELTGKIDVKIFHIGSGLAVLQGWEIEIDGAGWNLDVSGMTSGIYYYTIYIEVNAELETAEIKYLYDTVEYPQIDPGDDLTEAHSGISRLVLYNLTVSNGSVSKFSRAFVFIPYEKTSVDDLSDAINNVNSELSRHNTQLISIESRLSVLGFRQGSCSVSGASNIQINSLKRQGKYVILDAVFYVSGTNFTLNIPSGFRPKSSVTVYIAYGSGQSISGTISTSGSIGFNNGSYTIGYVYLRNIGWETADN